MTRQGEIRIYIALIIKTKDIPLSNVGFTRSLGAISEVEASEGVCFGSYGSKDWANCETLGEPSPTPVRSNRSHTCCFKGYFSDPKKGSAVRGAGGTHRFQ